jgi:alpha-1,2-mannosyltransferase
MSDSLNNLTPGNGAEIAAATRSITPTRPRQASDSRPGFAHRLDSLFRDPTWLTRRRIFFYSGVLMLAYVVAAIAKIHDHTFLRSGVSGDFVNIHAASIAALKGDPAAVYDIHRQHLQEISLLGTDLGVLGFHYPPMYLLIVLPLSMLPFIVSWILFETATLAGYIAVVRRIVPVSPGLWLAITFPGVIVNFTCGQNGFLTTALIGGGLLMLDRAPILAGMLFGLMSYKPQFAVLIPLALIAARRWRAFAATAVTAILFAAASFAVFGASTWHAFFVSVQFTQKIVLEQGGIPVYTLQTVFGAIRMWGGSVGLAYALQAAVALYAAAAVIWIWQSDRPIALKAAALAAGSLMVSPYVLQYDLVLLALPIAWLAMEGYEKGFLPYEKTMLLAAWILPRIGLAVSQMARIPIAPIVIAALMTAIIRRATCSESAADRRQPGRVNA